MRHYNPVLHGSPRAWAEESTKRYKGGSPTSTSYVSNVPPGMEGYYKNVFDIAQQQIFDIDKNGNIRGIKPYTPYSANPADYVAGFSPMQQQSFTGAANLQVSPWFGQGADLARSAGLGGLDSASRAYGYGNQGFQSGQLGQKLGVEGGGYYGNLGAQIGQMGLNAQNIGQDITGLSRELAGRQAQAGTDYYGMATNPYVQEQFMSPYMQNVVDLQKAAAQRDFDVQNQTRQAQAAKAGAFGGSRQAIEQAEANKALNAQLQNIEAQGLQSAYDKAIQSMQFGSTLGLQGLGGAQSGLGTALQGGQLGLQGIGTALQGVQTGLQGVGTQMQGTGQGMQGAQTGLQGVSGAQAGYGLANQSANTLGSLATQQGQQARDILNMQNLFGGQQQTQQQNITDQAINNYATAQQWPLMQLQYLFNALRGGQGQGMTTQNYRASPSALATGASLASIYGGGKMAGIFKEGGIVKLAKGGAVQGYAGGGDVMSQDNVERIAEKLSIPQLQQAMQNKTVDEYIGIPLLAQKQQEQQRMQMAQAAMQAQQGQQPTIKDAIMAQLGQAEPAGIDTLSSNLPVARGAEGGIVAFAEGGEVPGYAVGGVPAFGFGEKDIKPLDLSAYEGILKRDLNPETNQPYTEQEIYAQQERKRTDRGISKDLYADMLGESKKRLEDLPKEEREMLGFSVMAGAFEALAEGEPDTARGLGNLGAKISKNAAAVKRDFKDRAKEERKEQQALLLAQDGAKRADLAGDQAAADKYRDRADTHATNIANLKNDQIKQINEVNMQGRKAEYDLMGKEIIQSMENAGKIRAAMKSNGLDLAKLRNSVLTATASQFEKTYGTNAIESHFDGDPKKAEAKFKELWAKNFEMTLQGFGGEGGGDSNIKTSYTDAKAGDILDLPQGKFKKLPDGRLELIS